MSRHTRKYRTSRNSHSSRSLIGTQPREGSMIVTEFASSVSVRDKALLVYGPLPILPNRPRLVNWLIRQSFAQYYFRCTPAGNAAHYDVFCYLRANQKERAMKWLVTG